MKRSTNIAKNGCCNECVSSPSRMTEIGGMLILVIAGTMLLSKLELFPSSSVTPEGVLGLGAIFLIGITASFTSCLAMVGGLLLSISAKWSEAHKKESHLSRFLPLLQFNVGRIGGYFLFGGLTGLLGRSLVLSVKMTGLVKISLAIVMVVLGLSILRLIPKNACRIPLPKALWNRIRLLQSSESKLAPILLGAVTFFVPCGFTQSMQLLALGSGSFFGGAAIMTMFALGTLPALIGISTASSFADGKAGKFFFTFAGTLSIVLGVLNIQSGFALTGIHLPTFQQSQNRLTQDPNVTIDRNGQQVISVGVQNSGYSKNLFTIDADKPTWIYATAKEQLSGCISSMAIPEFNVSKALQRGENWIGPIRPKRDFAFMCSMGMFRADVHVRS